MASVTNDKLVWLYTNYGLRRITEVLENPTEKLRITRLVVGDSEVQTYNSETGQIETTYDYYVPTGSETSLRHSIASFYFHSKELDEENLVVSFTTNIPQDSNGYAINEMGIYENETLFAICTCQDINKPFIEDNYLIDINMRISLHSKNLSSVYDRIRLESNQEYLTPSDLEQLQYNVLYMEGNLCEQISQNSHIIGLNRPRQLEQLIDSNLKYTSTAFLNSIYCTMANIAGYDNVRNFWVFDYSKYTGTSNSIIDMGYNGEYLTLKNVENTPTVEYEGICPTMNFSDNNFYSTESINDIGTKTWFFLLKNSEGNANATILAKSDYKTNKHEFEILRRNSGAIEIRLFAENGNYIIYTSEANILNDSIYSLGIKIPENYITENITVVLNGYELVMTKTTTGSLDTETSLNIGYSSFLNQSNSEDIRYENKSIMGLMAKLVNNMSVQEMKRLTLLLIAFGGTNVCMNFR